MAINNKINTSMIYRLFRKERSVQTPLGENKPPMSESLFIQQISRMIKLVKRREHMYMKIVQQSLKPEKKNSQEMNNLLKEYQKTRDETNSLEKMLVNFKHEVYYSCKSYLYTAYMRINEMLDAQRSKYKQEGRRDIEKEYQNVKNQLNDMYTNQSYQEKYQITDIFALIIKNQHRRIAELLPKKRAPLSPIVSKKLLERITEPTEVSLARKTQSIEFVRVKEKQVKIEQIVNRKLAFVSLDTESIPSQRKKTKPKSKPKVINLYKLYDILEVKPPAIEKTYSYEADLLSFMVDRNQKIKEEMKNWEKRYTQLKNSKKQRK